MNNKGLQKKVHSAMYPFAKRKVSPIAVVEHELQPGGKVPDPQISGSGILYEGESAMLNKAIEIAARAHQGQVDKGHNQQSQGILPKAGYLH